MVGTPVPLQVVAKCLTETTSGRKVALGHGVRGRTIRAAEAQGSWSHGSPEAERDGSLATLSFLYSTHGIFFTQPHLHTDSPSQRHGNDSGYFYYTVFIHSS